MILIIDNYDSFVFNIARYFNELGEEGCVVRNDAISPSYVSSLSPSAIVVSPGPCTPAEAGVSLAMVRELSGKIPILGVCLGHQCIGAAFGGSIERATLPLHGQASLIAHCGRGLFENLPSPLQVGRYHSLIVGRRPEMDEILAIDAVSAEGDIMALSHRQHPTFGVQFHPESVLTECGHRLLANFLRIAKRWPRHVLA